MLQLKSGCGLLGAGGALLFALTGCEVPQRLPVDAGSPVVDLGPAPDLGPGSDLGDDAQGPCGLGEPVGDEGLILGTGVDAFRPLCSGDEMEWVFGMANGSTHLEGGFRLEASVLEGLTEAQRGQIEHEHVVRSRMTALEVTDREIADRSLGLVPGPDGSLETWDVRLVVSSDVGEPGPEPPPGALEGQVLQYTVFVEFPDGRELTKTATVVSRCCR